MNSHRFGLLCTVNKELSLLVLRDLQILFMITFLKKTQERSIRLFDILIYVCLAQVVAYIYILVQHLEGGENHRVVWLKLYS
jgi:hypothetical protein